MRIEVTAGDIENGVRNACGWCPIALALHRATGEKWFVREADAVPVTHHMDGNYSSAQLPQEARHFIQVFDRCGAAEVEPFAFDLDVIPDAVYTVTEEDNGK